MFLNPFRRHKNINVNGNENTVTQIDKIVVQQNNFELNYPSNLQIKCVELFVKRFNQHKQVASAFFKISKISLLCGIVATSYLFYYYVQLRKTGSIDTVVAQDIFIDSIMMLCGLTIVILLPFILWGNAEKAQSIKYKRQYIDKYVDIRLKEQGNDETDCPLKQECHNNAQKLKLDKDYILFVILTYTGLVEY